MEREAMGTLRKLTLTLGMAVACAGLASAHATKPMPRVTITGKVLVGDAKAFKAVGIVDRRVVFDAIPAIRTLRAERVARDTARYHFLVYEANRAFQRAVQRAAAESKIDLIVDAGGVSAAGIEVRDLTELTRSLIGREP
jgi:hypothetical protein